MGRKHINTDWELAKPPKVPKSIRAKGFRGLLGVVSPSRLQLACMSGDTAAQQYSENIRKYLNYRRLTNRREWKVFYRYLRWQNRMKGTKGQCTET